MAKKYYKIHGNSVPSIEAYNELVEAINTINSKLQDTNTGNTEIVNPIEDNTQQGNGNEDDVQPNSGTPNTDVNIEDRNEVLEDVTKLYDNSGNKITNVNNRTLYNEYLADYPNNDKVTGDNGWIDRIGNNDIEYYTTTGYIPVNEGEKYRIKGAFWQGLSAVVGFATAETTPNPEGIAYAHSDRILSADGVHTLIHFTSKLSGGLGDEDPLYNKNLEYIVTIPSGVNYIKVCAIAKDHPQNHQKVELSVQKIKTAGVNKRYVTERWDESGNFIGEGGVYQRSFYADGTINFSATDTTMTGYIRVSKNDRFKIIGVVDTTVPTVVGYSTVGSNPTILVNPSECEGKNGYDSKRKCFFSQDYYNDGVKEFTFSIENDDVKYIRFAAYSAEDGHNYPKLPFQIIKIEGDTERIVDDTNVTKRYDEDGNETSVDTVYHKKFKTTCEVVDDDSWDMTGLIEVNIGEIYAISGSVRMKPDTGDTINGNQQFPVIVAYDANKNVLGSYIYPSDFPRDTNRSEGNEGEEGQEESLLGDLNKDGSVDIADAITVLNIMASGSYVEKADLNKDGNVDIADYITVLNIMAAQ